MPPVVQTVRPLVDFLGGKDVNSGFKTTYNNVMTGQQNATQAAIQNRLNITAQKKRAADTLAAQQAATAAANAQKALKQRQAQAEAIAARQQAAKDAQQQKQIAALQEQIRRGNTPVAPSNSGQGQSTQPVGRDDGQGIHYSPGATANGSTAIWGDPRSPGWQANNLVSFRQGKISVTVNRQASTAFRGFLNQLTKGGYHLSSVQGYNLRNKRTNNTLSEHAFGTAIDINPSQNPSTGTPHLVTNMPTWVGALAARYGLIWGGTWNKTKDAMHFEYVAPSQRGRL